MAGGYFSVFGQYPSQRLLEQNAGDAIRSAEELQRFAKTVGHLNPSVQESADELLRRLREYRESVPSYF